MNKKLSLHAAAWLAAAALAAGSAAADTPPPSGVVNLTASASAEVAKDLMTVTLSTTKEGADSAGVQSALKKAVDAALAEARKVAKPGQVEVQTGNFSLYPRYDKQGLISGWHGTAELLVEGRDMAAIGQLAGRITTLAIGRVAYGLSRETREKAEAGVAAQAIASYLGKAADYAKAFGYTSYTVREVNVMANEPPSAPVPMMRAQAMAKGAEDSALPVEAGKATVSVTVTGSLQMH